VTRLLCMYNDLDPRVAAALDKYAYPNGLVTEWIDTSESLQTYAEELGKRWNQGDDIILVEQDKELTEEMIPSLMACDELWCGYAIWFNPVPHTMLAMGAFGIVKFSQRVQELVAMSDFEGQYQFQIDRRFYDHLIENHDAGCHIHGMAVHHHVYKPRPQALRDHVQRLREEGILPPQAYPEPKGPHLLPGSYDISEYSINEEA
jgi:hypothetical protein